MQLDAEVKKSVIDISSSGRESVTRVMMFLYGGKVAAAAQEEVLEDLLTDASSSASSTLAMPVHSTFSLRGCLGIVIAASVSVLLFIIHIENEVFVAFTNVCFCCIVAFLFL